MEMMYKLIALSVVFGLVVAEPVAKVTHPLFDDLRDYESPYQYHVVEDEVAHKNHAVEALVEKPLKIGAALSLIKPILVKLKTKALSLAVVTIKWIVSKGFIITLGAIATLAFCKLTGKCNLAHDPVYTYVPAQVRNFVTPERLEDAHSFLLKAVEEYEKQQNGGVNNTWF